MVKNIIIYILIIMNTISYYFIYKMNDKNQIIQNENSKLSQYCERLKKEISIDKKNITDYLNTRASVKQDKKVEAPKETFTYIIYLKEGGELKGDNVTIKDGAVIIGSKNSLTVTLDKMDISKVEKRSNRTNKMVVLDINLPPEK